MYAILTQDKIAHIHQVNSVYKIAKFVVFYNL